MGDVLLLSPDGSANLTMARNATGAYMVVALAADTVFSIAADGKDSGETLRFVPGPRSPSEMAVP
ncbi:MAG TPA: hypothetical protein DEB31_07945 [Clostridiales bacterium]|nr:hypothetical protein [Clostridiales bacterium]